MVLDDSTLFKDCPFLLDKKFQEQFPGVIGVASFIEEVSQTSIRVTGEYKLFDDLGVKNIYEYIKKIQQGDKASVETYIKVQSILGFG